MNNSTIFLLNEINSELVKSRNRKQFQLLNSDPKLGLKIDQNSD